MKQNLLFLIALIISTNLFSQESRIGIELNYPLLAGENFINKKQFRNYRLGGKIQNN